MNEDSDNLSDEDQEGAMTNISLGEPCAHTRDDSDNDEEAVIDAVETPYMKLLEKRSAWRWRAAKLWRPQLLAALAKSPAITVACQAAGIDYNTYTAHVTKDAVFAKACAIAERMSHDLLLQSAWEDAVIGYEKPVYQGGVKVGTIIERSDTMRAMLLKGFIPERFDRAQQLEIRGMIGHVAVTPELLSQKAAEALQSFSPLMKALADEKAIDVETEQK